MGSVPAVRLPGYELQRSKAQVVLYESHRAQEVYAGARYPPFEMPGALGAVVACTSLYDRNSTLCSILCSDSARHAPGFVRSFALTVLDMLRFSTTRSVAEYLGVGWDMVKNIHKERLQFLYRKIPLHEVGTIGIDEFSFKEGHHYMTVVTDLKTGRVLHAVEGRGKEDIRPFLEILARKAKKLQAVAMDMSSA